MKHGKTIYLAFFKSQNQFTSVKFHDSKWQQIKIFEADFHENDRTNYTGMLNGWYLNAESNNTQLFSIL